jgi:hypothetical protein
LPVNLVPSAHGKHADNVSVALATAVATAVNASTAIRVPASFKVRMLLLLWLGVEFVGKDFASAAKDSRPGPASARAAP